MNGYSKIKVANYCSEKLDSFEVPYSPQTQKGHGKATPSQEPAEIKTSKVSTMKDQEGSSEAEDEPGNGNFQGVKLSRNCSVSGISSNRFRADRQSSTRASLQSVAKRAFSMRRSSSVSERYCRIYDQYVTTQECPFEDDIDAMDNSGTHSHRSAAKKKSSRGKIVKACKRIFGL